jgi:cytochrome c556
MKRIYRTGMMVVGAGLFLATGSVVVTAQEDKAAQVKARQDFMEDQQHAVNAINAFAKGTGDRAGAIDGVNKLIDLSKQMEVKFAALFPPGTSSVDLPGKSKTKPELWQHLDEVKAAPAKLREAELKLVDVVKTADAAAVGDAMRATYRGSCNALCHDSYRVPAEPK